MLSYTNLTNDSRVQKQIEWLLSDGWEVDTLGFGMQPNKDVSSHFRIIEKHDSINRRLFSGISHLYMPFSKTFKYLVESTIPTKKIENLSRINPYDLVLVNDIDLLPWVTKISQKLHVDNKRIKFHLDIHEFHEWTFVEGIPKFLENRLKKYHAWIRGMIGNQFFTSRSTVAEIIAEFYSQEFDFPKPTVIRNSKKFEDLNPSPVDPEKIQLVYHGNSDLSRGLGTLIESLPMLNQRYHMNFMLTGTVTAIDSVKELVTTQTERVTFHEAVPIVDVPKILNQFDLGLIYFPPETENFRLSLPNKFFESIQARLGVVVGDAPSMQPYIDFYKIGINVPGWGPEHLANTLNALKASEIERLKSNTNLCAEEVNSESDRLAMLSIANS